MLIKSREEHDKKIVKHTTCGWCRQLLDYPQIVAQDANSTSYHVGCALKMAMETMDDISALLNSKDLPEISHRIMALPACQTRSFTQPLSLSYCQ